MKRFLIFLLKFLLICSFIYLIFNIFFDMMFINFKGDINYYITDDVYLSQTSRYMVQLRGKYGISEFVYKIGWNERYIVAIQYDLKYQNNNSGYKSPDKSKENYYIVDLEEEKLIGPLTKDEFYKYDCSSIKMKRTTT